MGFLNDPEVAILEADDDDDEGDQDALNWERKNKINLGLELTKVLNLID